MVRNRVIRPNEAGAVGLLGQPVIDPRRRDIAIGTGLVAVAIAMAALERELRQSDEERRRRKAWLPGGLAWANDDSFEPTPLA